MTQKTQDQINKEFVDQAVNLFWDNKDIIPLPYMQGVLGGLKETLNRIERENKTQ